MELKVRIATAVCVLLLHVLTVVTSPVNSSDYSFSESSSYGSSDTDLSLADLDIIEIVSEDKAFEVLGNSSKSSEMVAMELILLENENAPNEIKHLLVEGDIMTVDALGNAQSSHDVYKRNALRERSKRWPEGVVPYIIDDSYDATSRGKIVAAFNTFHTYSCIRFTSRTDETDYIHILPKDGCWSYVGRTGGSQELSLNETCLSNQGTIIHELMHALGFGHEHNRPDRDDFVTINWDNIDSGERHNFVKYDNYTLDHLNTTYDFRSVMHFNKNAFSINDGPTIVPKPSSDRIMGNRKGLSRTDKLEINRYYECSCRDMDSMCRQWAITGSCETNRDFMYTECRKSCMLCGPGSNRRCLDRRSSCTLWRAQNHCEMKHQIVKVHFFPIVNVMKGPAAKDKQTYP